MRRLLTLIPLLLLALLAGCSGPGVISGTPRPPCGADAGTDAGE